MAASIKKLIGFSPELSNAVKRGARLLDLSEASFIRSACIVYLRQQGDDEIDALLDELKRLANLATPSQVTNGLEIMTTERKV